LQFGSVRLNHAPGWTVYLPHGCLHLPVCLPPPLPRACVHTPAWFTVPRLPRRLHVKLRYHVPRSAACRFPDCVRLTVTGSADVHCAVAFVPTARTLPPLRAVWLRFARLTHGLRFWLRAGLRLRNTRTHCSYPDLVRGYAVCGSPRTAVCRSTRLRDAFYPTDYHLTGSAYTPLVLAATTRSRVLNTARFRGCRLVRSALFTRGYVYRYYRILVLVTLPAVILPTLRLVCRFTFVNPFYLRPFTQFYCLRSWPTPPFWFCWFTALPPLRFAVLVARHCCACWLPLRFCTFGLRAPAVGSWIVAGFWFVYRCTVLLLRAGLVAATLTVLRTFAAPQFWPHATAYLPTFWTTTARIGSAPSPRLYLCRTTHLHSLPVRARFTRWLDFGCYHAFAFILPQLPGCGLCYTRWTGLVAAAHRAPRVYAFAVQRTHTAAWVPVWFFCGYCRTCLWLPRWF